MAAHRTAARNHDYTEGRLTNMAHTCRNCGRTTDTTHFFKNTRNEPLSVCVECMAKQRKADNPEAAREIHRRAGDAVIREAVSTKKTGDNFP